MSKQTQTQKRIQQQHQQQQQQQQQQLPTTTPNKSQQLPTTPNTLNHHQTTHPQRTVSGCAKRSCSTSTPRRAARCNGVSPSGLRSCTVTLGDAVGGQLTWRQPNTQGNVPSPYNFCDILRGSNVSTRHISCKMMVGEKHISNGPFFQGTLFHCMWGEKYLALFIPPSEQWKKILVV